MRALKILVVTMGVLILVGLGVVIVTIVNRTVRMSSDTASGPAAVEIPAGSRIVETTADGDRLVLRLALEDGAVQLLVLDIDSGRLLRRIDVRTAGPPSR